VPGVRASAEDLAAANRAGGVHHSIVSSLESLLSRTPLGTDDDAHAERRLEAGNTATLGLCRGRADLSLMAVVDPTQEGSLEQAAALLATSEVVGIKLHPDRHHYNGGANMAPVCRLLTGFPGKVLLVHCTGTRYSAPEPMVDAALDFPAVPVILAHLGRTDPPGRVIEHITRRRAGNVFVDTSALRDAAMVRSAVSTIGAARVLFGSDFPFYRPGDIISLISSSGITEDEIALILEINARELLNLG